MHGVARCKRRQVKLFPAIVKLAVETVLGTRHGLLDNTCRGTKGSEIVTFPGRRVMATANEGTCMQHVPIQPRKSEPSPLRPVAPGSRGA